MKAFIGWLAAGLLVAGCGGAVAETGQEEMLSQEEGALGFCSERFRTTYYSDETYQTQVGFVDCHVCGPYMGRGGTTSPYKKTLFYAECP